MRILGGSSYRAAPAVSAAVQSSSSSSMDREGSSPSGLGSEGSGSFENGAGKRPSQKARKLLQEMDQSARDLLSFLGELEEKRSTHTLEMVYEDKTTRDIKNCLAEREKLYQEHASTASSSPSLSPCQSPQPRRTMSKVSNAAAKFQSDMIAANPKPPPIAKKPNLSNGFVTKTAPMNYANLRNKFEQQCNLPPKPAQNSTIPEKPAKISSSGPRSGVTTTSAGGFIVKQRPLYHRPSLVDSAISMDREDEDSSSKSSSSPVNVSPAIAEVVEDSVGEKEVVVEVDVGEIEGVFEEAEKSELLMMVEEMDDEEERRHNREKMPHFGTLSRPKKGQTERRSSKESERVSSSVSVATHRPKVAPKPVRVASDLCNTTQPETTELIVKLTPVSQFSEETPMSRGDPVFVSTLSVDQQSTSKTVGVFDKVDLTTLPRRRRQVKKLSGEPVQSQN